MCRMLLALGKINLPPLFHAAQQMALDRTTLHERNEKNGLGTWQHSDGWGLAYTDNQKQTKLHKSTTAISNDHLPASIPKTTTFALLHIRAASIGKASIKNTHPFYYKTTDGQEFLFCHNGTIHENIKVDPQLKPQGETDTEKIFLKIIHKYDHTKDIKKAFEETLNLLPKNIDSNFILSTKERSYFISCHHQYPRYLQMYVGTGKDIQIISSEKIRALADVSWKPLQKNKIQEFEHQDYSAPADAR